MDPTALLALDQGTTSSRAMVFDLHGRVRALAQQELPQSYPAPGWVEHDPAAIWDTTLATARQALAAAGDSRVAAIGLTNQRETTLLWDRATGQPVAPAIVWQDRRTADHCARLGDRGHAERITAATGLVVDPYFSATKLAWLLEHVPGCRARAERGDLAFGTVDTWLLWNLTGGTVHATDATNAARTMLFDIHHQRWDPDLLALFDIPAAVLPEVRDSAEAFGTTPADLFGRPLAVTGMAGDQQAALIGQACIRPGMMKSTYGTGCFMVVNTGARPVRSRHHLLTTVAYRLDGQVTYALEGAIFVAGAAVQWLRDGLGVIAGAAETEALAAGLEDNRGVYLVPAFTGLGAPHWDPEVRGPLIGLTRDSGPAVLARAALESVGYQTADLMAAMTEGLPHPLEALRVDGGMVANDWFVQDLADILDLPVERPEVAETTAWGAACLAALGAGLVPDLQTLAERWRSGRRVAPALDPDIRARRLTGWRRALAAARVAAGHPIA